MKKEEKIELIQSKFQEINDIIYDVITNDDSQKVIVSSLEKIKITNEKNLETIDDILYFIYFKQ